MNSRFYAPAVTDDITPAPKKRLLIIGQEPRRKGRPELRENRSVRLEPVGFLDDAPEKRGRTIHGIKVLGRIDEMGKFLDLCDEILIAIPSAKGGDMRRIVEICERTGKMFRTLPSIGELIDGHLSVNAIRRYPWPTSWDGTRSPSTKSGSPNSFRVSACS